MHIAHFVPKTLVHLPAGLTVASVGDTVPTFIYLITNYKTAVELTALHAF